MHFILSQHSAKTNHITNSFIEYWEFCSEINSSDSAGKQEGPTCLCPHTASAKLLEWKAKDKAFLCPFKQGKLIAPAEMKTLHWKRN